MGSTVEIPLWLAILAGLLGLAGLLDRIIGPSLRWLIRKRLNRAIKRLNVQLDLKIPSFKLTRRKVLIDRLAHDPQVMAAMEQAVAEEDMPRDVALEKVERYARETVPAFSPVMYFSFGMRVARWISERLYRVRVGVYDKPELDAIDREAAVVFVMNHRSNIDYLLVTYLAARRVSLSYAVGEWANVWGLRWIIRSMGAFFIRRNSGNPLYRKVVARYISMAVEGGVSQAMFPEGGLTRDGRLKPAKLGLLAYICADFKPGISRDVVFVPVGLNYDRVVEDRILLESLSEDKPRYRAGPLSVAGFILRLFWMKLRRKFQRFGYACVSFGAPLSLTEYQAGGPLDVAALGDDLMARVGAVIPVLPVPVLATVLLDGNGPVKTDALEQAFESLSNRLKDAGAHLHMPREGEETAFESALRALRLRGLLTDGEGGIAPNDSDRLVLQYYANSIAHLV